MEMIRTQGLSKVYGSGELAVTALEGVDLTVKAGEVLMLVGPSGSGKTTLLSILGCVLQPSHGSIQLMGEELAGLDESRLPLKRLRYIGFIFQSHNLLGALTALENARLPLLLRGRTLAEANTEAADLLVQVGLGDKVNRLPEALSGGEKQRVAIARALAGHPPILLADEPTASLDHRTGEQVMNVLTTLAHQGGHAVVLVTHDSRIFHHADRLQRIEDGRLVNELESA
jgi:putative ABC transport system ATP-binding protein